MNYKYFLIGALIIFITVVAGFCIYDYFSEEPDLQVMPYETVQVKESETIESETSEIREITDIGNPHAWALVVPKATKMVNITLDTSTAFVCGTPELDLLNTDIQEVKKGKVTHELPSTIAEITAVDSDDGSADIPEPYFKVNDYQREVLIHLLYFEACGCKTQEDILEQRAVVSVVFNRFTSGEYKGCYDLEDIVFFKYPSGAFAFSPASDKDRFWFKGEWKNSNRHKDFLNNYDQLAEKVDWVIQNGPTVPENVKYFVSNACSAESNYFKNNHKVYKVYDDTTFMTDEKP